MVYLFHFTLYNHPLYCILNVIFIIIMIMVFDVFLQQYIQNIYVRYVYDK